MAEPDTRTGIAAGLAVGLASVAVLGVGAILLYLLFRRDDGSLGGHGMQQALPQPITLNFGSMPYGQQSLGQPHYIEHREPVPVVRAALPSPPMEGPKLSTTTVPKATPVWVAAAGKIPVRVRVRPVAPVAGFVVFAYDAAALQGTEIDQSNGFIVPVGQEQEIRLAPRQALYARAITPPAENAALISIARTEAPSDI